MNSLSNHKDWLYTPIDEEYQRSMLVGSQCGYTSIFSNNAQSFIRVANKNRFDNINSWITDTIWHQRTSTDPEYKKFMQLWMENYWMWALPSKHSSYDKLEDACGGYNFETYKQLKQIAQEVDPSLSKEEIYEKLLKPFRHQKTKVWSSSLQRFITCYLCKYSDCGKSFSKVWNLIDHVRMHEGIKPYECRLCNKTFTQKGNLKKHTIIQHSKTPLAERKRFECNACNRKYTERYNLTVSY